jgi:mono/diheme cytochrome c family protein
MSDTSFNSGTRSQPLGQAKAGLSADLDALAAYVGSLATFANSPYRNTDGTLTTQAVAGRAVFESSNCASCHGGTKFTVSGAVTLFNVGTIKQPGSGLRLGGPLTGIDPPTLRDVWATAPYLHDGSAATLTAAVRAHSGVSLTDTNVANLSAYLQQIGAEEVSGCPCSIWKPTDVPASSSYDTTTRGGVELGTRFRASTTGYIKAIRFYKHTGNTGTHVGSLWSASGSLLGRATFSNETATGWQEVKLATPIKVTANTWYVVSYLTKSGKFIGQNGLFDSSGLTNGPLYAARDGENGDNGLYRYTSSSAFPNRTGNGQGYWVDVVYVNQ